MSHYYQYFAVLNVNQEQVGWVEPYDDESGAGTLILVKSQELE